MSKPYQTIVFIGRFQPPHLAHLEIIRRAQYLAEQVIVVVGSSRQPRTFKNPFSFAERRKMILSATDGVFVEELTDTVYNDQAWAARVQGIVSKYEVMGTRVGIIGHEKDDSSFYLKMFPQWERIDMELNGAIHATDIRDLYFRDDVNLDYLSNVVAPGVVKFLENFRETGDYRQIVRERKFIEQYKKQFESLPYPPIFVTVDAVVVQSGHVLLIKRRSEPGQGLWALPGGFLNADTDKSVRDAALRELKEETGIKVPIPVLTGSIIESRVFDATGRSTRGRTITHAFLISLPNGELPKVRGQDDAERAAWVPISELGPEMMYEDHYSICEIMFGNL